MARKFGVSYQTAHRILVDLEKQGLLRRSRSSGTYISAGVHLRQIELCFHPRARQRNSFGARLLHLLERALQAANLEYRIVWVEGPYRVGANVYPILWETCGPDLVLFDELHQFGLILNDRPPSGLRGSYLDSLSTDDYSGGAAAAELLIGCGLKPRQLAILAGPANDERSRARVRGFLSIARKVAVTHAESWYYEAGIRAAPRVLRDRPAGVFCANDRLAAGIQDVLRERGEQHHPTLVGYDNAPIAALRGLTTIAIPWEEIALNAAALAISRLGGDTSPARSQIYAPRPLIRW